MIKILLVGRGRRGMPVQEQRAYMKNVHGAAVVRLIAEEPDVAPRRYVQNHVVASFPPGSDGPARDFVTQVWFDDHDQMRAAFITPRYVDDLQPDEDNFVDRSSVTPLPTVETVLVAPAGSATTKVFLLLPAHAAVPVQALPGGGWPVRGLVRNEVRATDAPYALVLEAWFDELEVACSAAEAWQHDAAGTGAVALVATEHVLHDGPHGAAA
jgi:hypothetical protein